MFKVGAYTFALAFWALAVWTLHKFDHGPISVALWPLGLGVVFFVYKYVEQWVLVGYRALLFRLASQERLEIWLAKNKPPDKYLHGLYGKHGYYDNLTLEIYEYIVGLAGSSVFMWALLLHSSSAGPIIQAVAELGALVFMLISILSAGLVTLSYQLWRYYPTREELSSIRANSKLRKYLRFK